MNIINRINFGIVHNGNYGGTITTLPVYKKSSTDSNASAANAVCEFSLTWEVESIKFSPGTAGGTNMFADVNSMGANAKFYDCNTAFPVPVPPNVQSISYSLSSSLVELVSYANFVSGCDPNMKCLWIKENNPAITNGQSLGTLTITIVTGEGNTVVSPALALTAAESYPAVTIPIAPSGVYGQVMYGPKRVILTWSDNSGNETSFNILRKVGSGSYSVIASVGPNVSTYTDTTVTSGAYCYQIQAVNSYGTATSAMSNVVGVS